MNLESIRNGLAELFAITSKKMAADKVWSETELDIKTKAVGGKVELINPDGTLSPLADGDYTMDNGDTFTLKDGLITKWNGETEAPATDNTEMAEPETPTEEETPAEDAPEEADTAKQMEDMQAQIDELKTSIEEIKTMIGGFSSKEDADNFSKQLEDLTKTLKLMASIPVESSQTDKRVEVKDAKEARLQDFARAYAELKNKN